MRRRVLVSLCSGCLLSVVSIPASADGVLPVAATPVQREQAQSRFLRGKVLMGKHKYEEALAQFTASHEIVASPNTRLESARCLLEMGKVIAGYAELGRAAVEAKELVAQDHRYQRALDAATSERAEIEAKVGFVSLTIDRPSDSTRVTIGGDEIARAAWDEPAPVQAGTTEIVVSTPGRDPIVKTVSVAAGEKTALQIDVMQGEAEARTAPPAPQPAPPPAEPARSARFIRTGSYVAGGVGLAGLATFIAFGSIAHSTYDDLNTSCGGGPCPASKAGEISSGKTAEAAANVGLAFAIAGAAAGVTLFVISRRNDDRPHAAALTVSPGWIGVEGNL